MFEEVAEFEEFKEFKELEEFGEFGEFEEFEGSDIGADVAAGATKTSLRRGTEVTWF